MPCIVEHGSVGGSWHGQRCATDLVPWPRQMHDQLEWHWRHFRSRLEGLDRRGVLLGAGAPTAGT